MRSDEIISNMGDILERKETLLVTCDDSRDADEGVITETSPQRFIVHVSNRKCTFS
jgi:hypothetical protein